MTNNMERMKIMKIFTYVALAIIVFGASEVFACGGGCGDKDKKADDAAFVSVDQMCGGGCGDKDKKADADNMGCCGDGCKKDKDKPCPKPDDQCGGDKKGDDSKDAGFMCGGGCDKKDKGDKDS